MKLTTKVGTIGQTRGDLAILGDHIDNALLDEVHLGPNGSLLNDVVSRLEYFIPEFGYNFRYKIRICVSEEWHGCHQCPTVVIYYFLQQKGKQS